ncbi:MAG: hypothetical protein RQ763_08040 [Sulfurimonas sp.]|uniref:hypothetical protein n=1 Tax=Sulfurimonas sp. TaxID=2022749 RepID=UPI0028CD0E92|nr:hypothetical protein [Sulfurimonas sp.]MDT8339135.1 hypothetical protein [Sulfurimonas sp.]
MQKLKITVPVSDVESEIDPDDFEIEWLEDSPDKGRIIRIKNPDKYPKLVNKLAVNRSLSIQPLDHIVFEIKKGEQK